MAVLDVTPRSLSFTMVEGGENPASQSVLVENSGTASLSFGISSDASWLSADPSVGLVSSLSLFEVSISVDGAGLTAGELNAVMTVEAEGAVGSPVEVAIDLSVTGAPRCTGTPAPCTGRAMPFCMLGCTTGAGCAGGVIDCSLYSGGGCNFCETVVGCACGSTTTCAEAPDEGPAECTSQTNQTTCIQFDACTWRTSGLCMGTPTPCETLDNETCAQAPGCVVAVP
jgi:hypothetical protein